MLFDTLFGKSLLKLKCCGVISYSVQTIKETNDTFWHPFWIRCIGIKYSTIISHLVLKIKTNIDAFWHPVWKMLIKKWKICCIISKNWYILTPCLNPIYWNDAAETFFEREPSTMCVCLSLVFSLSFLFVFFLSRPPRRRLSNFRLCSSDSIR